MHRFSNMSSHRFLICYRLPGTSPVVSSSHHDPEALAMELAQARPGSHNSVPRMRMRAQNYLLNAMMEDEQREEENMKVKHYKQLEK